MALVGFILMLQYFPIIFQIEPKNSVWQNVIFHATSVINKWQKK